MTTENSNLIPTFVTVKGKFLDRLARCERVEECTSTAVSLLHSPWREMDSRTDSGRVTKSQRVKRRLTSNTTCLNFLKFQKGRKKTEFSQPIRIFLNVFDF
ncbi:hypothetical protein AVEN_123035-1 [Araneus ventricosus]|uniref:Uncharacterized protein n=1 Tax=Araneus ventricosus TaxID=182803 RepID=A0A4Y2KDE1_ARAVE|nr:hypothetical protein AVEN_123035-1 [Araneus ventricosus]